MVVDSKTLNEVIEGDLSMLQVLGDHVGWQDLTKSKRFPDSTSFEPKRRDCGNLGNS